MGRGEKTLTALPPVARRVGDRIELRIKVVPGASRSEVVGALGDRLKIRVAAPPERGRANEALVGLLREWLGGNDVEIVGGSSSLEKTVRVSGITVLPKT